MLAVTLKAVEMDKSPIRWQIFKAWSLERWFVLSNTYLLNTSG